LLAVRGIHVSLDGDDQFAVNEAGPYDHVVYLGGFEETEEQAAVLRDRSLGLKRILSDVANLGKMLWVVCYGAVPTSTDPVSPIESGFWAFARSASNEFPKLNIRRIDLSARLTPDMAASRISELLLSRTDEAEVYLSPEETRAVRIGRLEDMDLGGSPAAATRLKRGGSLDYLRWTPAERAMPNAREIEIAVEAIGLNFRDLMLATGLLPDDILEGGAVGATLGIECVGRIMRVGTDVEGWQINDRIMAFAPSAFSDYVTTDAALAWRVPKELPAEAAATIPVAFLTAYHAIITLGKLRRGQWVLIHGGAGGVGLAAMQIARWRGARIIASAGTAEKRALLEVLGAHHTIDSRAGDFEHDIQRITGSGVDLVLNSLAGEGMERSIRALKPFGHFVELGKRDYVLNTHIGLRPFHRNLTYHGVDLDQLLRTDAKSVSKMVSKLAKLFEEGRLTPLPYRCFPSDDAVDAFRLMQQSAHIGKIVIAPPTAGTIRLKRASDFTVNPDGTHLVTGGLGGFGVQVASWLAGRGARHLVLVGRRADPTREVQALLAEIAAAGVTIKVISCDVSDRSQVESLLCAINEELPPLCGIIHCAMVLDDGLIENLDAARLEKVLRPKVAGAENLDQLTRAIALDYFVLFSSATTFIGNPGQGAYVAANGYLEGLARRRRSEGLPALAVSWGAISDAGVVASNRRIAERLAERVGVQGIPALEALDMMADALGHQGTNPDEAVVCIAKVNWATARAGLPVLASPTYSALTREALGSDAAVVCSIDLQRLIEAEGIEAAKRAATGGIIEELSRVLRMPAEDIAPLRPLSELGIDSLMAAELGTCLEARFGIEKPISVSLSSLSVSTLAGHIVEQCKPNGSGPEGKFGEHLVRRHFGQNIDASELAMLSSAVQNSSVAPGQT
jgi:phthiocerol/phenolphthiocerol synthesis type-I polyketide synthase C